MMPPIVIQHIYAGAYSPKCVEEEFCEVHLQDPALVIRIKPGESRLAPVSTQVQNLDIVVVDKDAVA
jgi:hypothetical protein